MKESLSEPEGLIRLVDASLTYRTPPGVMALRPTSFCIGVGEYIAVTGPSGSGKSTLLSVMGLLESPSDGEVWVGGISTTGLSQQELGKLRARTFGFVFQRFHLLPSLSALENVGLSLSYQGFNKWQRRAMASDALSRVGLHHRLEHKPFELSGGEQQRVAIARAIACEQPCLLADEPTGNLDSATTESVLEILDAIAGSGTTVVCVTHSDVVSQRARRQMKMLDGVVVADSHAGT